MKGQCFLYFSAGLAGEAEHVVGDDVDARLPRPAENVHEALVGDGALQDVAPDPEAPAFYAVLDMLAPRFSQELEKLWGDGLDAGVDGEGNAHALAVDFAITPTQGWWIVKVSSRKMM